jgi:hypothetical protein
MSSARFWGCLIWIGVVSVLYAHDPGLSSVDVEIGRDQISVTMVFNTCDAQTGAPGGLDSIRERCFEIALDGQIIAPRTADPVVDANNNVEYQLRFPRTPAMKLLARSPLLVQLPFGHRQYLKIQDADGHPRGKAVERKARLGGNRSRVLFNGAFQSNSAASAAGVFRIPSARH